MNLHTRLTLVIGAILLLGFGGIEYSTYQATLKYAEQDMFEQAEKVRGVLMATRRVYHHQFLNSGIPLNKQTIGFLPAHALNRISDDFHNWDNSGFHFNNVSDQPRNQKQAADELELKVMDHFRQKSESQVYFQSFNTKEGEPYYLYARPIWIEKYCLQCHGKKEEAPLTIQELYDTSYGYSEGELRGLLSIKLPASTVKERAFENFINGFIFHLSVFVVLFVLVTFLIRKYVKQPLEHLSSGMNAFAAGRYGERIGCLQGEFATLGSTFNEMADKIVSAMAERKKIEHRISDALAFNEKIIAESPIGISIYDPSGKCIAANEAIGEIIGVTKDQVLAQNYHQVESWKKSGLYDQAKSAINENCKKRYELKITSTFGKEIYLDCHLVPFLLEEQTHLLIMINDISERMKAEEELKYLRNYLKNIVNSMPSILIGVDQEGNITEWNQEAEKITGMPIKEVQGRLLYEVFPQLSREMKKIQQAIEKRQTQEDLKVVNMFNGETRFSDVTIYPLIANGAEGAVIRVDDVTERVRLEEMMIQTEKMMSIGGLAAGMAHEINNPLSIILQSIQNILGFLSLENTKNHKVAQECNTELEYILHYLEKRRALTLINGMKEATERSAKIVSDMLAFSHRGGSEHKPVDIVELVEKTIKLAATDYDLKKQYDFRHIKIIREFDSELNQVHCAAAEIQQVLLNLLRNAAQAMFDQPKSTEAPQITLRIQQSHHNTCIEVEDNGPGMDLEIRKRIFEPFFTTKQVGIGTGLGLSVSYFIVTNNHKGQIAVESIKDKGTKFVIQLPLDGDIPENRVELIKNHFQNALHV